MKAIATFGTLRVECEGTLKEIFAELSEASEILSNNICGNCGSTEVRPNHREHDGNHFYEMSCTKCRHTLGFGQRKADGKLFPRLRDKDGNWLPNDGWQDWRANRQAEPEFANF